MKINNNNIDIRKFSDYINNPIIKESVEDKTRVHTILFKQNGITNSEDSKAFLTGESATEYYITLVNNKFDQEFDDYESAEEYVLNEISKLGYELDYFTLPLE